MKLSANRLARWLAHGERSCVSSEQANLVFNFQENQEVFPFASWDGRCHIERGLIWGNMTFYISPLNAPQQKITVFGLPWRKVNRSAYELTVEYQNWLNAQRKELKKSEHKLIALHKELDEKHGYLRHSDLVFWQQRATKKFKAINIEPRTLEILNPFLYQSFYGWFIDGEQRRDERNEWWYRRELQKWQSWFATVEKSPLNDMQQNAVLMGEDNSLILAGAGSGKTSVLIARCRYLVESKQCEPKQIVMLAFGKKASEEMKQRLAQAGLTDVHVATFHSFAMKAIQESLDEKPVISLVATDNKAKKEWMSNWLSETFNHPTSHKRWLNHLEQWNIVGLNANKPLIEQVNKSQLHKWLWRQLDILLQHTLPMAGLKKHLANLNDQQGLSELTLLMPLQTQYQRYLSDRNEYDFHGLIDRATDLISRRSNNFALQFAHVLVDEFQDISPSRMAFLQALCKSSHQSAATLFAVGDDWQAIYRFAGSDVSLTTEFAKGAFNGKVLELDTTYRFNSKIGEVANAFIQVNPKQRLKVLNSDKVQTEKAVHVISMDDIEKALAKISKMAKEKAVSLMFIGRNNNNKPKLLSQWQKDYADIKMSFSTAHASKGLEADYSIIVDVNQGVFPAQNKEAGLEYSLLTDFEEIEHAEERRLFYVAMTRARHACWVACDPLARSIFIDELLDDHPVKSSLKSSNAKKKKNILTRQP